MNFHINELNENCTGRLIYIWNKNQRRKTDAEEDLEDETYYDALAKISKAKETGEIQEIYASLQKIKAEKSTIEIDDDAPATNFPFTTMGRMLSLYNLDLVCHIHGTHEYVVLDEPALDIDGKPTFLAIRGFPVTVTFEWLRNRDKKYVLRERGYSSHDIEAICNSAYTQKLLKMKKIALKQYIMYTALIIALEGCICYIMWGGGK